MHKYLIAALISLGLTAPAAMADGDCSFFGCSGGSVNVNLGSGGVGVTVRGNAGGVGVTVNGNGGGGAVGPAIGGLPMTNMDSMVFESGGCACLIYGDEGTYSYPPYFEFTKEHRINRGITGVRAQGLTTGHSEMLPDAWGGDEWTGNEWDMSGSGACVCSGWHSTGGTGNGNNTGGLGTSTPGVTINLNGCGCGTNVTINGTANTGLGTISGTACANF